MRVLDRVVMTRCRAGKRHAARDRSAPPPAAPRPSLHPQSARAEPGIRVSSRDCCGPRFPSLVEQPPLRHACAIRVWTPALGPLRAGRKRIKIDHRPLPRLQMQLAGKLGGQPPPRVTVRAFELAEAR